MVMALYLLAFSAWFNLQSDMENAFRTITPHQNADPSLVTNSKWMLTNGVAFSALFGRVAVASDTTVKQHPWCKIQDHFSLVSRDVDTAFLDVLTACQPGTLRTVHSEVDNYILVHYSNERYIMYKLINIICGVFYIMYFDLIFYILKIYFIRKSN